MSWVNDLMIGASVARNAIRQCHIVPGEHSLLRARRYHANAHNRMNMGPIPYI